MRDRAGRTGSIFPPADLNELLDIGDFGRHTEVGCVESRAAVLPGLVSSLVAMVVASSAIELLCGLGKARASPFH